MSKTGKNNLGRVVKKSEMDKGGEKAKGLCKRGYGQEKTEERNLSAPQGEIRRSSRKSGRRREGK